MLKLNVVEFKFFYFTKDITLQGMWLRIFVFLFFGLINAQNGIIHYSIYNGLPHNIAYGLFQDSMGYLWIGTDNGLVKYDGNHFKLFTIKEGLRSNYVIDINETEDHKIVVGTWGGGIQFIKNDSVLLTNANINKFFKVSKLAIDKSTIIACSGKNDFNVLFNNGINYPSKEWNFKIKKNVDLFGLNEKLDKNNLKALNPVQVKNRFFYIGGNNFGLQKIKGIVSLNFKENSFKEEFPFMQNIEINDLIYENGSYIALGNNEEIQFTENEIINIKPIKFKETKGFTLKRFIHTQKYNLYVFEDEFHISDKIILFDNVRKKEIDFSSENKLTSLVSDVLKDKDENIWISLNGQGVYFIPNTFEYDNKEYFNNTPLYDALELKDNIYFLSLTSLHSVQGNSFVTHPTKNFLEGFNPTLSNNDTIFVTSSVKPFYENVEINQEKKKIGFLKSLFKNKIQQIGVVLSYWKNSMTILFNDSKKAPITIKFNKDTQIKDIQLIQGELWVATNLGFYVYDTVRFEEKKRITSKNGLSNSNIKSFASNNEKIFVATIDGLNVLGKEYTEIFNHLDGLPTDNLNHVFVDHHNIIWISHQKGYSIFKDGFFFNFTNENGNNFSYVNKIFEDKNNFIWIVGSNGARKINNIKPFVAASKPSIQIDKNNSRFNVNIIDFSGDELLLEYKINDSKWAAAKERFFDFSNFKFGDHTVIFRARRPSSEWNYSSVYSFSIDPPWYKTWWGMLLILIFILGLLVYRVINVQKKNKLLQVAISNQKRLEKELSEVRENVASDFHDELGNKLAGITVVSELMLKDETIQQSQTFEMLQQIQKDAKSLYFGIRDFVWSIDSNSDFLEELIIYLSDFGEELFHNSKIVFKVDKINSNKSIKLPMYWSRHLLLLFKEAMTNAYKHSNATEVTLIFKIEDNKLEVQLQDNGIGFIDSALTRKNGLNNMFKRVEKINGKLKIDSTKGTCIHFIGEFKT